MPVIKSNNAPTTLSPFSMKDIEQHAKSILMRAQQQAEQLIAEAQIVAEQLKQKAVAEGIIDGRKEGLTRGTEEGKKLGLQQALNENKQQLTQLITALATASKDLNASRKQLESAAMTEVIKLAVSIARRVTKRYGELDPNVLTANVSEAMKLVVHSTDVRITLNPAQKSTLTKVLPQLKLQWPALAHVELCEDAAMSSGGCCIRAGAGEVNADLDLQIDRIAGELLPTLSPSPGEGRGGGSSNASPPPQPSPGVPGEGERPGR